MKTQLPWVVADWQLDDGPNKNTVEATGKPSTWWPGGFEKLRVASTEDGNNPLEDAAFIVEACNNYESVCAERDRLKAALEAAYDDPAFVDLSDDVFDQVEAALEIDRTTPPTSEQE